MWYMQHACRLLPLLAVHAAAAPWAQCDICNVFIVYCLLLRDFCHIWTFKMIIFPESVIQQQCVKYVCLKSFLCDGFHMRATLQSFGFSSNTFHWSKLKAFRFVASQQAWLTENNDCCNELSKIGLDFFNLLWKLCLCIGGDSMSFHVQLV